MGRCARCPAVAVATPTSKDEWEERRRTRQESRRTKEEILKEITADDERISNDPTLTTADKNRLLAENKRDRETLFRGARR